MQSRRSVTALVAAALLLSVATVPALAQRGTDRGAQSPAYDPKTEITLTGTVSEIQQMTMPQAPPPGRGPMMAGMGGVHLTLRTKDGSKDVHIGPSTYLAEKNFTIRQGDTIEITGSLVKTGGAEAVIAREVKKGSETLVLRDKNGMPLWSGYRSR